MSSEFEVDTARLSSDMEKASGCINKAYKNLMGMFNQLEELDTLWDGQANKAFSEQVGIDREFMNDVCSNLKKVVQVINTAISTYNRCENEVYSDVKSMKF